MREALWSLALLLAAYAAFEFLRALRLPREGASGLAVGLQPVTGTRTAAAAAAHDARDDEDDDFLAYAPLPSSVSSAAPAGAAPSAPTSAPAASSGAAEAEAAAAARFELELENSRLRQALQAQRDLVALQQTEIDRLVEDIAALRDELDAQASSVASSPEYSEAMVLARQGLNAEMIAVRCGITLAEAELVLALGRGGAGRP
jgi:hypothetical protein